MPARELRGESKKEWRDGNEVGYEGSRKSPKGPEPGFQSPGLGVLGMEESGKWGRGVVDGKRGLAADEGREWNLGKQAGKRPRRGPPLRRPQGVPGLKWEGNAFVTQFSFLYSRSPLVSFSPISDIVTSWRRRSTLGPSSVGSPKTNEEGGTLKGGLRRKGFWEGGNRGENWVIL